MTVWYVLSMAWDSKVFGDRVDAKDSWSLSDRNRQIEVITCGGRRPQLVECSGGSLRRDLSLAMSDERSHGHCAAMIVPVREDHGAPQDADEAFRLQG